MPVLKPQKILSALLKKGFIDDNSHLHYYEFWHNGQLVARTYTSHSAREIDDYLISAMSKQCKMDKQFFLAFINCTKLKDDYLELLKIKNII